ncbi:tyrosine-type recombinase/integrase [Rummeliibacillus suwonensis]|uniref:tyrosine-type recombinase/integrase n=1 Tax=Rummeliibacillus suwonensis TaxID=1306154 RepID=UPI0028A0F0B0|nr:tyrosine-type recombinase/integrase [Rummeliibacillus suwonensis]
MCFYFFISKKNPNALGTSSVRYNFRTVSKKLDFRVHPHILRHTYASILIANGIDVVTVADRLGDPSEMVLKKVYAHASKDKKM